LKKDFLADAGQFLKDLCERQLEGETIRVRFFYELILAQTDRKMFFLSNDAGCSQENAFGKFTELCGTSYDTADLYRILR
jgi:hypothetical protein